MTQIWVAPMHFLPVDYIKFINRVRRGLTEITTRLREHLMGNSHLLELLSSDRKQPAWDNLRQLEIFGEFFSLKLLPDSSYNWNKMVR